MNQPVNPTAWMIRNDGKAIPCVQHIYANINELYETLYAAEWLYKSTLDDNIKPFIIELVTCYGADLNRRRNSYRNINSDIKSKPYIFLTTEFLQSIQDKMMIYPDTDIFELCCKINYQINNEFLRARYGGLYNTDKNSRNMYFRISSNYFNWRNVIVDFLSEHKDSIDTVTVIRDKESTGENYFYRDSFGIEYNKYPVLKFLEDSKEGQIR